MGITYFANPTRAAVPAMQAGELGVIVTPKQGNELPAGAWWCADNGCFGKGYPGDQGYLDFLASMSGRQDTCWFATAPDVPGDARGSLERSRPFFAPIRELGYMVAFCAQNGLEDVPDDEIPWDEFDWLFLGGGPECAPCGWQVPWGYRDSLPEDQRRKAVRCKYCGDKVTEWKLGKAAAGLVAEAKRRGKLVHMGRVNSFTRLAAALAMGCDSADGTYLTFGPDKNLPKLLSWLRQLNPFPAKHRLELAA